MDGVCAAEVAAMGMGSRARPACPRAHAADLIDEQVQQQAREAALQPQVPSPEPQTVFPPRPLPDAAQSRPYTEEQWPQFHQPQTGGDDCNAFALAMAHNLIYADRPEKWLLGDDVQARLEHRWGVVPALLGTWLRWRLRYWYVPQPLFPPPVLLPNKVPGVGIPTWQYDNAVRQILPDAEVEHKVGATPEDLKRAIADGKIVIVAVGWETNGDRALYGCSRI